MQYTTVHLFNQCTDHNRSSYKWQQCNTLQFTT